MYEVLSQGFCQPRRPPPVLGVSCPLSLSCQTGRLTLTSRLFSLAVDVARLSSRPFSRGRSTSLRILDAALAGRPSPRHRPTTVRFILCSLFCSGGRAADEGGSSLEASRPRWRIEHCPTPRSSLLLT